MVAFSSQAPILTWSLQKPGSQNCLPIAISDLTKSCCPASPLELYAQDVERVSGAGANKQLTLSYSCSSCCSYAVQYQSQFKDTLFPAIHFKLSFLHPIDQMFQSLRNAKMVAFDLTLHCVRRRADNRDAFLLGAHRFCFPFKMGLKLNTELLAASLLSA